MVPEIESLDQRIIARACGDLPGSLHPFRDMAEELGIDEEELLARLDSYRRTGLLRRFGATLNHRAAGYTANGMSVWNVPDADVARAAAQMAASSRVSHCYERPRFDNWPYNLYAMIHERTREECLRVAAEISRKIGIEDYDVLFSLREFKKTSMAYFARG